MRIPGAGRVRALARGAAAAVRRRSPRGIVLLYHRVADPRFDPLLLDVAPTNFDAHLGVLRDWATLLPLDEFESARRRGVLPARAVAITFDDGYADNLTHAAPVLARHEAPATFFITTGMVGSPREFWWDDVERVVTSAHALSGRAPLPAVLWAGERVAAPMAAPWCIESRDRPARAQLYFDLLEALRPLAAPARDAALAGLRAWAGVSEAARPSHRAVTQAELLDLSRRPGVAIGAHTVTHPSLAGCDEATQRREMADSRAALATTLPAPVRALAYPFGTRQDVSSATMAGARAAGFDFAMANEAGTAWRWSSRWRVPRVLVRDWTADEFRRRLATWWEL